jgi:hypothetical protein
LEFYATEWEVSQFPIRQINAGSFEKLQIEIAMSVKTYGSSSSGYPSKFIDIQIRKAYFVCKFSYFPIHPSVNNNYLIQKK